MDQALNHRTIAASGAQATHGDSRAAPPPGSDVRQGMATTGLSDAPPDTGARILGGGLGVPLGLVRELMR